MIDLLRKRLKHYSATNAVQEEQAVKEMLQEVALYALWRGGFFEVAAFQGGTSLRILHGLPRFSEDLDFILLEADPAFRWSRYFESLTGVLEQFGVRCELSERGHMDKAVREAMLKDNSLGGPHADPAAAARPVGLGRRGYGRGGRRGVDVLHSRGFSQT